MWPISWLSTTRLSPKLKNGPDSLQSGVYRHLTHRDSGPCSHCPRPPSLGHQQSDQSGGQTRSSSLPMKPGIGTAHRGWAGPFPFQHAIGLYFAPGREPNVRAIPPRDGPKESWALGTLNLRSAVRAAKAFTWSATAVCETVNSPRGCANGRAPAPAAPTGNTGTNALTLEPSSSCAARLSSPHGANARASGFPRRVPRGRTHQPHGCDLARVDADHDRDESNRDGAWEHPLSQSPGTPLSSARQACWSPNHPQNRIT